jgi:hypothetical protein
MVARHATSQNGKWVKVYYKCLLKLANSLQAKLKKKRKNPI